MQLGVGGLQVVEVGGLLQVVGGLLQFQLGGDRRGPLGCVWDSLGEGEQGRLQLKVPRGSGG